MLLCAVCNQSNPPQTEVCNSCTWGSMGKPIFITLIFICLASVTHAGIYKWVDKNGQVHYGERPSTSQKSEKIHVRDIGKPANNTNKQSEEVPQEDKRAKLLRAFEEERNLKKEQRQKDRQQAEQRKRNCDIAKDELRRYQSASRVYDLDENGKRKYLPDSAREQSIQRARHEVNRWCGQ